MATTTTTRTTTRHNSAMAAARQGWHKWVAKNWGWFVPVLAVVGLARGGAKTVMWSAPKVGRATRWAAQHPVRFARWSVDYAKAQFADGLDMVAGLLDRHPKTQGAADKIRAYTGRTGLTCGYCSAQLTVSTAEAHMDAHNQAAAQQQVKPTSQPNVIPIRPRPAPAAAAPSPARPASTPSTSTVPAGATTSHATGGKTMTATGTSETQQLMRAANAIGDMDPSSAWELDAQLVGLQRAALVLTENLGQYIETLDRIKTDPRVTATAGVAVGQIAEVVKTFASTRALFRQLYDAQFKAADNRVRLINRPGFFDPSRAA